MSKDYQKEVSMSKEQADKEAKLYKEAFDKGVNIGMCTQALVHNKAVALLTEALSAIKVELLGSNRMYILLEFIDQALPAKDGNKPSSEIGLLQDESVDLQTFAEEMGFYRFFNGKGSMTIAEIIEVAQQCLEEKAI
jgi:hypothetical protein